MRKGYSLLLIAIVGSFILGCEKAGTVSQEEINLNTESDYLDSTYFSFNIANVEYKYEFVVGGLDVSMEPYIYTDSIYSGVPDFSSEIFEEYHNSDSVIIGFHADGKNSISEKIYLEFNYRISRQELEDSDTTSLIDLFKIDNFVNLIEEGDLGVRQDFVDSTSMVGAVIKYKNENESWNSTNLDKFYEELNSVSVPRNELDLENTYFLIDQRIELNDDYFILKGNFEVDIYNHEKNSFDHLSDGKFCIMMHK